LLRIKSTTGLSPISSASIDPLINTTPVSGAAAFTTAATWRPSIEGILRSVITTSKSSPAEHADWNAAMPAAPPHAVATTW
jgi:hypothetical protein